MRINVISGGSASSSRRESLVKEFESNDITDYEIWDGVFDTRSIVKSINHSHKLIVEYAQLLKWEEVCIAEDDLRFSHKDSFRYFLDQKPEKYDIYLSSIYHGDISPENTVKSFCGLHLYIVHSNFYDTFLSLPSEAHIDQSMSGLGLFKVCNPFIAYQANGFSQNTGKNEVYDTLMNGRTFYKG